MARLLLLLHVVFTAPATRAGPAHSSDPDACGSALVASIVSPMEHVLPGVPTSGSSDAVVKLAEGEHASFQVVVSSSQDCVCGGSVRVRVHTSEVEVVAPGPVRQLAWVHVSKPTNMSRLPYGVGMYPDPLPPLKNCSGAVETSAHPSSSAVGEGSGPETMLLPEQICTVAAKTGSDIPIVLWLELKALKQGARAEVLVEVQSTSQDQCHCSSVRCHQPSSSSVSISVQTHNFATPIAGTLLAGGALELTYLRPNPFLLSATEFQRVSKHMGHGTSIVHSIVSEPKVPTCRFCKIDNGVLSCAGSAARIP